MIFKKKKQPQKPKLIIISGLAGSGKTTIGKILAKKLNYLYLDKDTLTRGFVDLLLEQKGIGKEDRESEFYLKTINPIEYSTLLRVALENIDIESGVILSAPFIQQILNPSYFTSVLESNFSFNNIIIKIVWISTNRDTERMRLIDRDALRDKNKLANWALYCESVKDIKPHPNHNAYTYVNTDSKVDNINNKVEKLTEWIIE
jgi:dephospho-CoA kinase